MALEQRRWEPTWLDRWEALAAVLKRVRFVLLLVVVGAIALFTAQGEDVLRALGEQSFSRQLVALYGGGLLWALSAWFWARVALGYEFERDPERRFPEVDAAAREWLPRLIGAAAIALLGLAVALTGAPFAWRQAILAWALGLIFLGFVVYRRRLFAGLMHGERADDIDAWPGFRALFLADHSAGTRGFLLVSLALLLAMFLALTFSPVTVGQGLGTAGLFLIWAATMIPLAALADLFQRQTRFPLLTVVVAWAVLLSFFVENHDLQRVDEPVAERPMAAEAYSDWWIDLAGSDGRPQDARRPVFLVASEGGGIRSAYWTAAILGELQDSDERFGRQVFAMSGVSGGSFGLALFAAQVASGAAAGADDPEAPACRTISPRSGGYRQVARAMTGRDHLAPIVGGLLYPDLLQRVWPDSVESFDRARAFEASWAAAWHDACGLGEPREEQDSGNAFSGRFAFQELWAGERALEVPHLLLNATRVGSGQRALVSSLAWPDDGVAFADVLDLLAVIEDNPEDSNDSLPLVTAASLSARFPIVSPAGSLEVARGERSGLYRFGDGGYYENSGAMALADLIAAVGGALEFLSGPESGPRPVIVQISNDVDAVLPGDAAGDPLLGESPRYLGELLSPLRSLLNTRGARGTEERLRLRALARERGWPYLHFRLCDGGGGAEPAADPQDAVSPPLGWVLSSAAQATIDDHLTDPQLCAAYGVDNVAYLEAILQGLDGEFAALERFVPR